MPYLSPSVFSARGFQLSTSENKCFLNQYKYGLFRILLCFVTHSNLHRVQLHQVLCRGGEMKKYHWTCVLIFNSHPVRSTQEVKCKLKWSSTMWFICWNTCIRSIITGCTSQKACSFYSDVLRWLNLNELSFMRKQCEEWSVALGVIFLNV